MENTSSTERCVYLLYSPCSLFEQLFKAISKCLGGGRDLNQDHDHNLQNPRPKNQQVDTKSPSSETEREMKSPEEEFAVLIRRPPRPPPSSGGGGQIN